MFEGLRCLERPKWCPHVKDCNTEIVMGGGTICGGKLSEKSEHLGDYNTHCFCLKPEDGNVSDLKFNQSDCYMLKRFFEFMLEKMIKEKGDIDDRRR